jgi:hypothetical protein
MGTCLVGLAILHSMATCGYGGPRVDLQVRCLQPTLLLLWFGGWAALITTSLSIYHALRQAPRLHIALAIVPWCTTLIAGALALLNACVLVGWL